MDQLPVVMRVFHGIAHAALELVLAAPVPKLNK